MTTLPAQKLLALETLQFNLKKLPGYKNLPASSFGYFSAGGTYSDPGPYGNVEDTLRILQFNEGYAPIDDWIIQLLG